MYQFDKRVIIVDDFYNEPLQIREIALDTEYEQDGNIKNYPGKNSKMPFWDKIGRAHV